MSKQPPEDATNDKPWLPKFEPDRLAGLQSEPNEEEERLIATHIDPYARHFYEQQNARGDRKPFRLLPSPERFLFFVKIVVRTYVRNRDDEPAYKREDARNILKPLVKDFDHLSSSAELNSHLRDVFIEERMNEANSSVSRLSDKWKARAAEFGSSFDAFPRVINTVLGQVSQTGRKPQDSVRNFVNDLAFFWYYLAGAPPTYMHGDTDKNSPFREFLRIINNQVLPEKYRSENDFDAYGADAVKSAKVKIKKIEWAARLREAEASRIRKGLP